MNGSRLAPVVFRADANAQIGVGHVMRCLAVAEVLIERGVEVRFASRALPTSMARRLAEAGVQRVHVPEDFPPLADAAATLAGSEPGSWIVCDGYTFDAAYQSALMSCGNPLLAFDDGQAMANDPATIIVNPNIEAQAAHYGDATARLALGLAYLPLRRPFRRRRNTERTARRSLLITLGGADPDGATLRIAQALAPLAAQAEIAALVGPANPQGDRLADAMPPGVALLRDVDDMATLLGGASVVVAAAGITLWEAMACGAAVIGVYRDRLQHAALVKAEAAGLLAGMFAINESDAGSLCRNARDWLQDEAMRQALTARAARVVDGRGAERIADLLSGAASAQAA
jgi:UDP-2,4-diacetamido-2,4,6-trideoxy-beta-L-altropyranose hydrolase